MQLNTLQDAYVHALQDLYSAEQMITQALPKMENAASSPDLKQGFQQHMQQTQQQVQRLDQIFQSLGQNPGGETCKGMQGLIDEGEQLLSMNSDPMVRDAELIAAAQKVEHYEMAGYGTCRTWAKLLDRDDDVDLLQQTLDEEGQTDRKLTSLAEKHINKQALKQAA